jgi:hypothetical protein
MWIRNVQVQRWAQNASLFTYVLPLSLLLLLREFSGLLEETDTVNVNYSRDIAHSDFNASREAMLVASSVTQCSSSRTNNITFSCSRCSRDSILLHFLLQEFLTIFNEFNLSTSLTERRKFHD